MIFLDLWAFLSIFVFDSSFVNKFFRLFYYFILFCFNPSAALRRPAAAIRRPAPPNSSFSPRFRSATPCTLLIPHSAASLLRHSLLRRLLRPIAPPRCLELDLRRRASSAHHTSTAPSPNSGKPTRLINFGRRRRPAAAELRLRADSKSSSTE